MRVVRVGNPEAFLLEPMQELFREALKADAFPDPFAVMAYCAEFIDRANFCVLVAIDGLDLVGLMTAEISESPLTPWPFITHTYAKRPEATEAMLEALRVWCLDEHGHRTIAIFNQTGRSDEVHIRRFMRHGTGRLGPSLILYDWVSQPVGGGACLPAAEVRRVSQKPKTSPRRNTKRSGGSSSTSSSSASAAMSVVFRVLSWLRSLRTRRTRSSSTAPTNSTPEA